MKAILCITGKVVRGKGYGAKLGFPTANLIYPEHLDAKDGVYGGYVNLDGKEFKTAFCVGTQPTSGVRNVEVHLVDAEPGDLYDKEITIQGVTYIRPMLKYNTDKELSDAIGSDVQFVRENL